MMKFVEKLLICYIVKLVIARCKVYGAFGYLINVSIE
ncbi:hypothetical protein ECH_0216 [Ehrlichia chaffeensis str. Arkansas]|uniref:Uncharacterized protein n=1 Tax=Ehrlichia chaffeensis (strain ATCC CRL-10679 / Arkansas) TaxID=205920 RepID=Q2GHP4_EHRCR|nr:hypothetical protein ECH_0216 [Ehrlichia chaffeensis str. Arkansas]